MKLSIMPSALSAAMLAAACSNLDRSRDLANPDVPPAVTAAQVCSNCHGLTGNPVSPNFPRLAGQPPEYIVAQLKGFRSHQRSDPPGYEYMWGISRSLTDAQIDGLAEYFSKQVPLRGTVGDPALIAAGQKIFANGMPEKGTPACFACHGPNGQGLASFPRLAYQFSDYIVKQLKVFRETEGRPGTPMQQVTHPLNDQEMEAVAAYLQAFPETAQR